MQRFKDKVVVVTGGGSGIGRASCEAFAKEGAKVVVADIDEATGSETAETLCAQGADACFVSVDVSNADSVNELVATAVRQYERLDVYFSNAGVLDSFADCLQTTDALWNRVIGVNLSGAFYGARAALPELIKTQGNIVVTGSVASLGGMAGGTAYTASKFGVLGLVNQLACEFASQGVRVNAVLPGPVRTNIGHEVPEMAADMNTMIQAMTPIGRWAEPEEITGAVLYLASDAAGFVTGSALRVDGGWRSK